MTTHHDPQGGFTLIELLVVMALFSTVVLGFYSVMLSGQQGADTVQDVAEISQEARLGLNRLVRDTREASAIASATSTSYTVDIDFDGDGEIEAVDFERVTFAYVSATDTITIGNGTTTETLVAGVLPIAGRDMFSYSSNKLEYDANNDGTTTIAELDAADTSGATLLTDKSNYISSVSYAFTVTKGDRSTEFFTQAQLRNRR